MSAQQPHAHIMIGLPGSGKSTWIQKYMIGRDPPPVVLSTDAMIDQWAVDQGVTYTQAFGKLNFKEMKRTMMRQLREAVSQNRDIIVDQTNMSRKSRREKLVLIPSHYQKTAVVFSLPDNILRERLDVRASITGKIIPPRVIEDMAGKYDPPSREEFDRIIWVTV
jgi:predicted kinase